ncbi:uncharacterized protein K441DRAFT_355357 [Cenococcum geophilum 1.58]|uniref:uncharacterized protein n=1 Tax=Cenococcum geophilum 1.58 TaxID=794803 RepID=UPI000DC86B0C|nr:hypothetical protein K441DRAFT_355357 [Cenococcum geophilum 1.58]
MLLLQPLPRAELSRLPRLPPFLLRSFRQSLAQSRRASWFPLLQVPLRSSGQIQTITTTSVIPASTILSTIISTTAIVSIQPGPTVVETSLEEGPTITKTAFPSSSTLAPTCANGCEVDVTATLVSFPGQVSTSTVTYFTRSVDVFITGLPDGTNKTSYVTATLPNPPISSATSAITWTFNSVVLTYPTTYVAYIDFSHIFVVPVSTGCLTATEKLVLPSPTDFAPLIFPSASVSESGKPPSTLISYLNSLPTVLVQLSGTPIGSSCDPIVGGTTTAQVASTAVGVVSVTSVPAIDAVTSTHYSLAQEDTGNLAPPLGTSTPAPPPPSSTAALPQSFAPPSSSPAPAPSSSSAPAPSSTLGSSSEPNQPSSNPLQSTSNAGSGIFTLTTIKTSVPPPVPASSTVSRFTGAAAHPRADMRRLGLEGWLVGAAGLGLGWL